MMLNVGAVHHLWQVKLPRVVRYLDAHFVDQFFKDGSLRLSSFKQFAKHPDEDRERKDSQEGLTVLNLTGDRSEMFAVTRHGTRSYVLCAAGFESPTLRKQFGVTSGFRVLDTSKFAIAIAMTVPGFVGGLEGSCVYEGRSLRRHTTALDDIAHPPSPAEHDEQMQQTTQLGAEVLGADGFFLKDARFSHQAEYRFIWNVHYDVDAPLIVTCPAARDFCERLVPPTP